MAGYMHKWITSAIGDSFAPIVKTLAADLNHTVTVILKPIYPQFWHLSTKITNFMERFSLSKAAVLHQNLLQTASADQN